MNVYVIIRWAARFHLVVTGHSKIKKILGFFCYMTCTLKRISLNSYSDFKCHNLVPFSIFSVDFVDV